MSATAVDTRRWLVRYCGSGRGDQVNTAEMDRRLADPDHEVFDVAEITPPCTCQTTTPTTEGEPA